jgi:hypothetical protein
MTLDRRAFIVGTGAVTMAPALEIWPLPAPALAADVRQVEFLIEGWSLDDGTDSPDRVWLRLDRSCRAAWR